jgi:hypothetical protein
MAETYLSSAQLYFLDECAFSSRDFQRKYWTLGTEAEKIEIWHPAVTIKMLCMIDRDGLVAFCLCEKSFTAQAVANFTSSVLHHATRDAPQGMPVYMVLDNAPKNRTQKMKSIAAFGAATFLYITPTTPEHNMIENFFFAVKKNFVKLKHLQAINVSMNPKLSMVQNILSALHLATAGNFYRAQKMFLGGLTRLYRQNKNLVFKN